jgi:hypothetical protein
VIDLEPADPFPPGCVMRLVRNNGTFKYSRRDHKVDSRWAGVSVGLIHDGAQLHIYYGSSRISTLLVPGLPATHTHSARGTLTP